MASYCRPIREQRGGGRGCSGVAEISVVFLVLIFLSVKDSDGRFFKSYSRVAENMNSSMFEKMIKHITAMCFYISDEKMVTSVCGV